jgi:hypothetical protein
LKKQIEMQECSFTPNTNESRKKTKDHISSRYLSITQTLNRNLNKLSDKPEETKLRQGHKQSGEQQTSVHKTYDIPNKK